MKNQFLLIILFCASFVSLAQNSTEVVVPPFKDTYCELVKQLESGETDINYQDFRYQFIESKQFVIASNKTEESDSLKKAMYACMDNSDTLGVIRITKQMLSIDYTDMMAHKILRQTYKMIGDTANARKYKTIQFGLLNSIVKNGNGQSCETAWPVIQVSEEYFILQMIDAELQEQSIERKGGLCDRMDVKIDGKKKTYYFETTKVFEGYKKLGL
ncbi:DUF4919 domain-containing protein [Fluviicola chungangensis]|uniref:DUF4919 domain-containing protein n=1 Tax=Fluviicola chungangensis TaxID=2597671 RepID=A0A556MNM7_9FLAO|nr:DUF4919 domain-containing protein [Fluviicola chungangensis]TSJ41506.1 DUF4919 domain-containing protein [Fluviicola chungangensis]